MQLEADYEIIGFFFSQKYIVLQIRIHSSILNRKKKLSGRDSKMREVKGCEAA